MTAKAFLLGAALAGTPLAAAAQAPPAPGPAPAPDTLGDRVTALPAGDPFRPLLADPKQPQFIASSLRVDSRLRETWVGAVAFGENIGLVRWPTGDGLQLGIAGGVFAQFDLETESMDLLNADYVIGLPLTYRRGSLGVRVRLYHQSSHLGDEFLLAEQPQRVNLSFEAFELLVAKEIGAWRTYVGGEVLFRREPSDLDQVLFHAGLEYRHPSRWLRVGGLGNGRFVVALDAKSWEDDAGDPAWSVRTGLEFAPARGQGEGGRLLSFLLVWYDGFTPYGQFFNEELTAWGGGIFFGL
jgi:hypothetical protein